MGNSGAAISDPTAASYYNPSLLGRKTKDAYSIGGNTLGSFINKIDQSEVSSFSLNPAYLSSILIGSALNHEFFAVNLTPNQLKLKSTVQTSASKNVLESDISLSHYLLGYSMAFKSIPFALSYFAEYSQNSLVGFSEFTSLTTGEKSTSYIKNELKSFSVGISASGHISFDTYTFGFNFRSRQWRLFKRNSGSVKTYSYGNPTPSDYIISETDTGAADASLLGSFIILGHGFKVGDHEFLFDSQFQEKSELNYSYKMFQSFGYRMNSVAGHQFLCGLNQELGPEIKYLGQSTYYSVGYSWQTRGLRSAFGLYYYNSELKETTRTAGLTFGSEFTY